MINTKKHAQRVRRLQLVLLTPPGPEHHPWARCRWRRYRLTTKFDLISKPISLETYQHHAINLQFGNGSPDEIVSWLIAGKVSLSSLPCRVLFGGMVTPGEAVRIFRQKYSRNVDDRVQQAFAAHPFTYGNRWFNGIAINIGRTHIQNLYASLPEEIRDVTPLNLECHLRRKRTISLAA